MNEFNFQETNLQADGFSVEWTLPSGYEYEHHLKQWTVTVYTGETGADTVIAAAVLSATHTTLSITVAPYTEYNIGLTADFEEEIRDEDPYDGSSSSETYAWSSDEVLITFSTLDSIVAPLVAVDGDWPNYSDYMAGNLNLKVTLPDDYVSSSITNYVIQYRSVSNGNVWTTLSFFYRDDLLASFPDPIQLALTDMDPAMSHEFRARMTTAQGVSQGAVLTIYQPSRKTSAMKSFPYVLAIPTSLATPSSVFIGNLPAGTVYNPYESSTLPGDLQEWIYKGDALYDSVAVKLYHRSVAAQPSRYYPNVVANPTIVNSPLLHAGGSFSTADFEGRWWDLSTAEVVRCYAPVVNFAFNGANHPFIPVNSVMPTEGSWDWPTALLDYEWAEEIGDIASPEDHAVIGIWQYGYKDTPMTGVHYVDNVATELVGSVHEQYVRYLSGMSTAAIDYKVYVFIKHDNLLTDVFKLIEEDATIHTLSEEAADITLNGEQGKLFSATLNASPRVNNGTFSIEMDIQSQQFSVEDASSHSFGNFSWPQDILHVPFNNHNGPFYMDSGATITVVAPASPYSDASSQAMIIEFELTNPYPQPVLA